MSDSIPEARTEPDRFVMHEAVVSIMSDESTIGTDSEFVPDLLTDHASVVRTDGPAARKEWTGFLAASEASSLSFLADEPDLYGEEDGEPV